MTDRIMALLLSDRVIEGASLERCLEETMGCPKASWKGESSVLEKAPPCALDDSFPVGASDGALEG